MMFFVLDKLILLNLTYSSSIESDTITPNHRFFVFCRDIYVKLPPFIGPKMVLKMGVLFIMEKDNNKQHPCEFC